MKDLCRELPAGHLPGSPHLWPCHWQHSASADPAVTMTGLSLAVEGVSDSAPWSEIVFDLCPVPAAFTAYESARLHGFNAIEAHQMEFTFVADCLYVWRSLPTPPRGDAVTVPSRLNSVIAGARLPLACHGFHGRTHTSMTLPDELLKTDVLGRVRVKKARRDVLLDEFERGGTSAQAFAKAVGVKVPDTCY